MNKRHALIWLLILSGALLPLPTSEAKEDTAHLTFRKTADSGKRTQEYTVQPGDNIDRIVKKFIKNSYHRYTLIRQLNPELKSLHRIYPGQTLILPPSDGEVQETAPSAAGQKGKAIAYQVRRGDSLTRILKRQLHAREEEIPKLLKAVQQMNPGLSDMNSLRIGQTILLPASGLAASSPGMPPVDRTAGGAVKPQLPPEKELNLLKELFTRSHGAMTTRGSYYIPLPQMGRIAIDCSIIPVVEFDDGSVVLLDFMDRMPPSVQTLIEANWKTFHFVEVRPFQDVLLIFQKTINASASYTAKKSVKPLVLEQEPQVLISLDWLVTEKQPEKSRPYFQGILLASHEGQLLPERIKQYAEQKGFQLTEIQAGAIAGRSPSPTGSPATDPPSIAADNPMDLIFNLLDRLGYSPLKNQEVNLADQAGTGVNLLVKPDILVKDGERELLLFSKRLPGQLLELLSRQKKEMVMISGRSDPKTALMQVLSALRTPSSSGRYAFYLAEKGHKAKFTITLPAIKVERKNGPLYLIDYGLDRNLYSLLHENWKAEIVRY